LNKPHSLYVWVSLSPFLFWTIWKFEYKVLFWGMVLIVVLSFYDKTDQFSIWNYNYFDDFFWLQKALSNLRIDGCIFQLIIS
jgi:hypothetical protein